MAPLEICSISVGSNLPSWLQKIRIENSLQKLLNNNANKILSLKIENISKDGENYSSLLLRILANVELKDGEVKTVSFVLKSDHIDPMISQILSVFRIFPKEQEMYKRIIPAFEQLYKDIGQPIQFAPKLSELDRDIGIDLILMEDLYAKNFRNGDRIKGLDLAHSQAVLKKLAEFHAVSACYVEKYEQFSEDFTVAVFNSKNIDLLKQFNASGSFLARLKQWPNCQSFYEKLRDSDDYLVERLLENQTVERGEFNVLNHGDCWCNNIMFQYDAFGKIKNTLFVDFAICKYGSPANDLYYFILSSCAQDIKLSQFDYMIRYYYDHLVKNLKLLQYSRPLPKLVNIHCSLLRNGLAAYMVVSKVLPAVILENTKNANLEAYMEDKSKMKMSMFNNPKYIQAMLEILPWLDNRGLLDWK